MKDERRELGTMNESSLEWCQLNINREKKLES